MPPIPAKLRQECPDPGVGAIATTDDAVSVIGENRNYAACYKQKWNGLVGFYDNVRNNLGGKR